MPRPYAILDVFADTALAGNPLAVVLNADGLTDEAMQRIAAEFALSETVFVFPARKEGTDARLRIFTPARELPFAGHPTVGTAVLLALNQGKEGESRIILDEKIGLVVCEARVRDKQKGQAGFALPRLPEGFPYRGKHDAVALALGLPKEAIGFDRHEVSVFSAGNPFVFVPLRDRRALNAIHREDRYWAEAFENGDQSVFVYTRDCINGDSAFHARMFAPGLGIGEDPATGSAVAALAGVIARFDGVQEGERHYPIEQGHAMGRPSLLHLTLTAREGHLIAGRISGEAVLIARGELFL